MNKAADTRNSCAYLCNLFLTTRVRSECVAGQFFLLCNRFCTNSNPILAIDSPFEDGLSANASATPQLSWVITIVPLIGRPSAERAWFNLNLPPT